MLTAIVQIFVLPTTIDRCSKILEANVPRIHQNGYDESDLDQQAPRRRINKFHERDSESKRGRPSPHHHPRKVAAGQESFKCGHCRAFIGPTIAGGRHRNHCPLCLYSRHVDLRLSRRSPLRMPIAYGAGRAGDAPER